MTRWIEPHKSQIFVITQPHPNFFCVFIKLIFNKYLFAKCLILIQVILYQSITCALVSEDLGLKTSKQFLTFFPSEIFKFGIPMDGHM